MGNDIKGYKAVLTLSTINKTLEASRKLAALSVEIEDSEQYLSGCSIIMQGAALDQLTESIITNLALNYAVIEERDVSSIAFLQAVYAPLRQRVHFLPRLLSMDAYGLDTESAMVRDIDSIVKLRNRLVHIEDFHRILTEDTPKKIATMKVENDKLSINMPVPEFLWDTMSKTTASSYLNSLTEYCEQIAWPSSLKSSAGSTILKAKTSAEVPYSDIAHAVFSGLGELSRLSEVRIGE
jgi:hypothetical protein